jgi:hypothetical protein
MVNYKIEPTGQLVDVGGGFSIAGADVIETKTNQVLASSIPMPEAKAMARHLNLGGGFNGSTPAFFLNKPGKLNNQEETYYK